MTHLANDNDGSRPTTPPEIPDAYGQAAMLLVESLIHALIGRSVIGVQEAIELVTIAIDAKMEIASDRGENDDAADRALALLTAIRHSLSHDSAASLDDRPSVGHRPE